MAFIPTLLTFCFSWSLGATKWYKGGERGCIERSEAGVFLAPLSPQWNHCPAQLKAGDPNSPQVHSDHKAQSRDSL